MSYKRTNGQVKSNNNNKTIIKRKKHEAAGRSTNNITKYKLCFNKRQNAYKKERQKKYKEYFKKLKRNRNTQ